MSIDQLLVIGIVIIALAIPSVLAAYSESRPPRAGALMLLIGGVLLVYALSQKPGGYSFPEIPHVFIRVLADLIH
jgi:formate-dependent nitrite reductase membrane component NrfD